MYRIKNKIDFKNQVKASETIGISKYTLCRILNGKQLTSKVIAYCIVKYYDSNAEIEDYFTKEEN
jgi:DNA-binding XRE family transcriptional regulator